MNYDAPRPTPPLRGRREILDNTLELQELTNPELAVRAMIRLGFSEPEFYEDFLKHEQNIQPIISLAVSMQAFCDVEQPVILRVQMIYNLVALIRSLEWKGHDPLARSVVVRKIVPQIRRILSEERGLYKLTENDLKGFSEAEKLKKQEESEWHLNEIQRAISFFHDEVVKHIVPNLVYNYHT